MKKSQQIKIQQCVLTHEDFKRIAKVVAAQSHQAKRAGHKSTSQFTVDCSDDSRLESETDSVVSAIQAQRVIRFHFRFHDWDVDEQILVHIEQHNWGGLYWSHPRSYMEVSGNGQAWVNETVAQLQAIIDNAKLQPRWPFVVTSLCQVLAMGGMMWMVPHLYNAFGLEGYWLALFPLILMLFSLPISVLGLLASMLWPPVEIAVGPEHQKTEARRGAFLATMAILVVVPFYIGFLI